jgi:hypothetical protein
MFSIVIYKACRLRQRGFLEAERLGVCQTMKKTSNVKHDKQANGVCRQPLWKDYVTSNNKVLCCRRDCIGSINRERLFYCLELQFIWCLLTYGVEHVVFMDCVRKLLCLVFCYKQNCVCRLWEVW